jgi:hypothetical protein
MSRAESAAEDTRRLESQVETPPSRIGELMSNIIF